MSMAPINLAVRPVSLYLRQHRLGLRQPERHVHGTIQLDGGGQFGAGLLPPVDLGI